MFEVTCKGCGRTLVTTVRISDAEIAALTDHLRACSPCEPLTDRALLGEVLARIRVNSVPS